MRSALGLDDGRNKANNVYVQYRTVHAVGTTRGQCRGQGRLRFFICMINIALLYPGSRVGLTSISVFLLQLCFVTL